MKKINKAFTAAGIMLLALMGGVLGQLLLDRYFPPVEGGGRAVQAPSIVLEVPPMETPSVTVLAPEPVTTGIEAELLGVQSDIEALEMGIVLLSDEIHYLSEEREGLLEKDKEIYETSLALLEQYGEVLESQLETSKRLELALEKAEASREEEPKREPLLP